MSGINPERRKSAPLHQRLIGDIKPFHSHAFAELDSGRSLGAAAAQSFTRRREIDHQRRHVRRYRDSSIGSALGANGAQPTAKAPAEVRSTRVERPSTGRRQFREPPSRGYNPYD